MRRILVKCVGMRKRGEASRLKLTQIDPNAPKMNVYNDLNVAQKDEGERARGQAGRPPLGVAPCFWNIPPRSFHFRELGCFGPERERKAWGRERETLNLWYGDDRRCVL